MNNVTQSHKPPAKIQDAESHHESEHTKSIRCSFGRGNKPSRLSRYKSESESKYKSESRYKSESKPNYKSKSKSKSRYKSESESESREKKK